jgi:hypothetical protein
VIDTVLASARPRMKFAGYELRRINAAETSPIYRAQLTARRFWRRKRRWPGAAGLHRINQMGIRCK